MNDPRDDRRDGARRGSDERGRPATDPGDAAFEGRWSGLRRQLFDLGEWRLRLAELHGRAGRAAAAEGIYRAVLARHPGKWGALDRLGRLLMRERRWDEAVPIWREAAALRPHLADPSFQFARALHRSGRLEAAAEQYLQALAADPIHQGSLAGLEQVSKQLARAGRRGQADPAIGERLREVQPGSRRALRNAEAIAKAIASGAAVLAPRSPEVALGQLKVALSLAPDLPEALHGIADCCERLGKIDEAVAAWDRLAAANPQAIEPRLQRERLLARPNGATPAAEPAPAAAEHKETILARLRTARGRHPQGPGGFTGESTRQLLRLARAAYNDGRLEDAEAVSERILAADAIDANALSLIARLYLRQHKWPQAIAVLTRLDAVQSGSVAAKEMLARALLQDGQFEAAARVYEELDRLKPGDPAVLGALARTYGRLQDWKAVCRVHARLVERDPSQPQARLEYGRALQRAGNIAEAAAQFEAVIAANPREPDALALLARLRGKNDPDGAFDCWAKLAELRPEAIEPPLQMARIRARQGRGAEARPLFQAVLDREPDHAEALAGFGLALSEADRDEAIRHFARWIESRPDDPTPRLELARLYQKTHDWDRAEAIYREILERDPHNEAALSRFAQLLARDHARIDHALDLWRRIGERDPAAPFPFVQRAYLLERVRRFGDAEAEYRAAIERAPEDPAGLLGLARLLSNQGRWAEAAERFEALHRTNPGRTDILLGLGRCLERLGRGEDALDAYQKVLLVEPGNANALLYRGRLLRQLGRVEEAIDAWRQVCAKAPQNADAWAELVFMLATAERDAEGLAALDAAEAALPASAQTWIRLGRAAQAGQFHERAVGYFERAVAAEPGDAAHRAQLGQYYYRQGIVDGAFHSLHASRRLKPGDLTVTKQLVETVHILNDCGIDHIALAKAPPRAGAVLVPERLFGLVRRIADSEVAPYEPVPRRIIEVSSSLAAGGAERQLANLLCGLGQPALGLDLALFCISLSSRMRRDFYLPLLAGTPVDVVVPEEGAADIYLQAPETLPYARLIRRFPEDMVGPIAFWLAEFRRRRPQIVHAWQDSTNLTAVVAALLAGVPRIVLGARSVRPDNPRRRFKRFMKDAYQAVLGHPSVVLGNNSRAGAKDYADWLGIDPASVAVVYNGIDFDGLEASVDAVETRRARDSLGIPATAPVLGSAFRMSEEKRPLLWVEAAAAVARQRPETHFIVCGDGPMRSDMAALAVRLGIGDRLHLPGPQANIASWYKAMDVAMLTSRHEGLPNVLLEAQCLGVPVVAPDVGGMSETVRQGVTGWTIAGADAAALAERVLFCLDDRAWAARAGAEAPGFVRRRFGIAAMLRRTLEVYGIAAAAGPAPVGPEGGARE